MKTVTTLERPAYASVPPEHLRTVEWTRQESNLSLLLRTHLERPEGIAPSTSAWQAEALLLSYSRTKTITYFNHATLTYHLSLAVRL